MASIDQMWRLSRGWYDGRLDEHFQPPPVSDRQSRLTEVGLTGDFWRF